MFNLESSKLRTDLLLYFFDHPEAEEYLRDLARRLKVDPTNLQRELGRWEKEGLFNSRFLGKQKFFKLNPKYPFLKEFKSIVSAKVGLESQLKKIGEINGVDFAFIYGSYARGKDKYDSDIDLLIIGKPDLDEIAGFVEQVEKKGKREINYRIIAEKELANMIKENNSFILGLLKNRKVFIYGSQKEFAETYRIRPVKKRS